MSETNTTDLNRLENETITAVNALIPLLRQSFLNYQAACCYRFLYELGDETKIDNISMLMSLSSSIKAADNPKDYRAYLLEAEEATKWAAKSKNEKAPVYIGRNYADLLVIAGMYNEAKKDYFFSKAEGLFNKYGMDNYSRKARYVIALHNRLDRLNTEERNKLSKLAGECATAGLNEISGIDIDICMIMMELCVKGIGRNKDDDVAYAWAEEYDKRTGNTNVAAEYFKKKLLGGYKCVYTPWIKK